MSKGGNETTISTVNILVVASLLFHFALKIFYCSHKLKCIVIYWCNILATKITFHSTKFEIF